MDKRQTLTRDEALALVRRYKEVIRPRFEVEPRIKCFKQDVYVKVVH